MSNLGVVTLCSGAMAVNAVYEVRTGNDPFGPLIAGGILTAACVVVSAASPAVGMALAAVFFLSIFLSRGTEIINLMTDLASN